MSARGDKGRAAIIRSDAQVQGRPGRRAGLPVGTPCGVHLYPATRSLRTHTMIRGSVPATLFLLHFGLGVRD